MKLSKLKLSVLLGVVAVLAIFISIQMVKADTGSNTYGYFWSSNIGWIKLNDCSNPGTSTGCSSTGKYGVNISPVDGTLSGYAWSSNIGWITFNTASCPTAGCNPGAKAIATTGGAYSIVGWARACSVYASGCSGALNSSAILGTCDAGGTDADPSCQWDGYIALDSKTAGGSGGTWGLSIGNDKTIGGFAWGSNVIGWIKSITGAVTDANGPTVTLVANPTTIKKGASSTLTVTATNIDGANSCSFAGIASGLVMKQQADSSWIGTLLVSPTKTTLYTVNCTKGSEKASASATVTVIYITTPPCTGTDCGTTPPGGGGGGTGGGTTGNGNGGYCTNTSPSFAWDSDATTCTITEAGGSSVTVAGSSKGQGGTVGSDGLYYYTPNLPVSGASTVYTLLCKDSASSTPINIPVTVNSCQKDFRVIPSLPSGAQACSTNSVALGVCQNLVTTTDGKNMVATFNVGVSPIDGFVDPVVLGLGSWTTTAAVSPDSSVFNPVTLSYSGAKYGNSQLTISIPVTKDLKLGDVFTTVINGVSDGLTRQAKISVTVGGSITIDPIYKEF